MCENFTMGHSIEQKLLWDTKLNYLKFEMITNATEDEGDGDGRLVSPNLLPLHQGPTKAIPRRHFKLQ